MSVQYFQRDSTSDLTGSPNDLGSRDASSTAGSSNTTISVGGGGFNNGATASGWFFTTGGVPGTNGTSTGTFEVVVRISTQNANIGIIVHLHRVNAAGTSQASVSSSSQTAGAESRTFTFNSPALGSWAAGDRLGVRVQFTNNSSSMNQSCVFAVNTSADTIDTPFTAAATVHDMDGTLSGTATLAGDLDIVAGPTVHELTGSVSGVGSLDGTLTIVEEDGFDPADLDVNIAGTTAELTWSASPTPGVVDYQVFRRTPQTGDPFDPETDTPVATGITDEFYDDESLAPGDYDWWVVGRIPA